MHPGSRANAVKAKVFSLFQPVTMAMIVLFWAVLPASVAHNPWTLIAVNVVVTAIVVALEFVNERYVSWRTNVRETATDLFYTILVFTVIAEATKKLNDEPLGLAKHALGITTPWVMHLPFVLQVVLVVFLIDFGQYWMHKAMHHTLLWWTHAPHHHITQMNAMKGAVGNPIELFLITLSVVALFDVPESAVFCALSVMNLLGVCVHSNVRYDSPRWFTYIFNTIEAHSLHHMCSPHYEDTRCNYAGTLIIIDRVLGTYRAGEAEIVGQDERKRLSIWQQFNFPFRELLVAIKARQGRSVSVSG
jgi:sterol desaturase/sphingolipid hydroxylase (fatty acid hydroxylase superfamily)